MPEKKPIVEMLDLLKELKKEIHNLKIEIHHVKEYIRKESIRQQLRDEKTDSIDKSFEKVSTGWFF
jgi:LytS/YehU family sensor histidine kinase